MPRDNSFSDSDQATPADPRGGFKDNHDFGIQRAVDGHDCYGTTYPIDQDPDGDVVTSERNVHYPNYEEDSLY